MSEEEKRIKEIRNTVKEFNEGVYGYNLALAILGAELEKALNLIEKKQEQLQEKDKVIDIMGRTFQGILVSNESLKKCLWKRICKIEKDEKYDCSNKLCEECVIEYFTKKARKV